MRSSVALDDSSDSEASYSGQNERDAGEAHGGRIQGDSRTNVHSVHLIVLLYRSSIQPQRTRVGVAYCAFATACAQVRVQGRR